MDLSLGEALNPRVNKGGLRRFAKSCSAVLYFCTCGSYLQEGMSATAPGKCISTFAFHVLKCHTGEAAFKEPDEDDC